MVADTRERVAMPLRPGTAPANDVTDHKAVPASAFRRLRPPLWSKLLVRIGTARPPSHALLAHRGADEMRHAGGRRNARVGCGWARQLSSSASSGLHFSAPLSAVVVTIWALKFFTF
ncbi:hypothetical protein GCM10017771_81820 [Streptomyces capitiformicae]|uniref:Uncharacterized protein n=1 Tax=Streptomyces capitiformicae TaxID=2014920 RepID=A0A919DN75_9ACTN|nr:hypothetical protein GCM10017771_81820 [Streptomyces capitiformicae]